MPKKQSSRKSTKSAKAKPLPFTAEYCAEKKEALLAKAHRLHAMSMKLADDAAIWAVRAEECLEAESSKGGVMKKEPEVKEEPEA
ncbi:hypothetical protein CEP52_004620 [Fusarium oligoseptatum]|uniref:Uncharacterized protein n=1 Tax=Fusarium oligoseptatum TaxID=2604345 RepID=A0A428U2S8_9HYPO|nr:hypothetical protein CEP52_004620 [Fusarium oligoseptatum]